VAAMPLEIPLEIVEAADVASNRAADNAHRHQDPPVHGSLAGHLLNR